MIKIYKTTEISDLSNYLMQTYGVSYRHFKVAIKPEQGSDGSLLYRGELFTINVTDKEVHLWED